MDGALAGRGGSSWSEQASSASEVVVETRSGKTHRGHVFAHDERSQLVILRPSGGAAGLVVLHTQDLKLVSSSPPAPGAAPLPALPPHDTAAARLREEKALQAAEAAFAKVGVDVTPEAQLVFDALSKTMPCRWRGKDIVVMDAVTISPPYGLTSLAAAHAQDTAALERVTRVLEEERRRLGLG